MPLHACGPGDHWKFPRIAALARFFTFWCAYPYSTRLIDGRQMWRNGRLAAEWTPCGGFVVHEASDSEFVSVWRSTTERNCRYFSFRPSVSPLGFARPSCSPDLPWVLPGYCNIVLIWYCLRTGVPGFCGVRFWAPKSADGWVLTVPQVPSYAKGQSDVSSTI
jgi:hypothetical protein